jgi:hypothetical protein
VGILISIKRSDAPKPAAGAGTNKRALGRLVSIEVGKIESEGLGEVQEMIDIRPLTPGLRPMATLTS